MRSSGSWPSTARCGRSPGCCRWPAACTRRACAASPLPRRTRRKRPWSAGSRWWPVASLQRCVGHLDGSAPLNLARPEEVAATADPSPDLSEVRGQEQAKRALEIAAAGHNLLMVGPPGSGKTMLARAFCSLLPTQACSHQTPQITSQAPRKRSADKSRRYARPPTLGATALTARYEVRILCPQPPDLAEWRLESQLICRPGCEFEQKPVPFKLGVEGSSPFSRSTILSLGRLEYGIRSSQPLSGSAASGPQPFKFLVVLVSRATHVSGSAKMVSAC